MKYIKKIILENFQSHKFSVIELDDRMNVIVGSSDSGKSAIIRGLKWVLFNEPSGSYFIREGENECCVTVEFNDNTVLKRQRSKTKNAYVLINNKGEELKFEGFGSTIPKEIIEAIGIKKIYLDSSESSYINLGEQLEGPFLLSEKTSTRASAIGRLVGVDIIDEALRETLKDIRSLNITRKSLEDDNKTIKNEIEEYMFLNDLKDNFNKVRVLEDNIKRNLELLNKLKTHRTNLIDSSKEILRLENILQELDSIEELDNTISNIDSRIIKYKYINSYAKTYWKIKEDIESNSKIIKELYGIELANDKTNDLENKHLQYNKLNSILKNIRLARTAHKDIEHTLEKLDGINIAEEHLGKVINSLETYRKLKEIMIEYYKVNSSIVAGDQYIEKFSEIDKVNGIYYKLDVNLKTLLKYTDLSEVITKYREEIKREELNLISIDKSISEELSKYETLLKKFEVCPFCFSEIDNKKIDHIVNHYLGG